MVESSLEATRRLLQGALDECENQECNFYVRTAMQTLEAMQEEIASMQAEMNIFEDVLADHPELETRLAEMDAIEK